MVARSLGLSTRVDRVRAAGIPCETKALKQGRNSVSAATDRAAIGPTVRISLAFGPDRQICGYTSSHLAHHTTSAGSGPNSPDIAPVFVAGGLAMATVNPRRVLVIDDNVNLAENIAEILQIDGCVTQIATSAEEAFPKALESEPDVIVTDYRLPGITGADFVKQFRRTRRHIYAVVISAYTDDRTTTEARDAGARFMVKPVDFRLLSRWVRQVSWQSGDWQAADGGSIIGGT
jgi:CheY-like chemotaxis protein